MEEPYFSMEAFAADNPHRIGRPMSDLKLIEADLDEIEARAARRAPRRKTPTESLSTLSFAAAAGDVEARKKLRQRAGLE